MDLTFDLGDSRTPKGHALVYFQVDTEPDKIYATYVVILPVQADLGKYVPPFLASHLGNLPLSEFSAFAMPPVPEEVASYAELQRLSQMRDDDLVYAGSMFSFDLPRMMESTTEVVQAYSQLCSDYFEPGKSLATDTAEPSLAAEPGRTPEDDGGSLQVNEVLFGLMSQNDKLGELSRLLGKLQFAQQGQDRSMVEEVTEEITTLARHLPEEFQISRLLAAAQETTTRGSRLAQLYLDRCFRLSAGDASSAQALEDEIHVLQDQE